MKVFEVLLRVESGSDITSSTIRNEIYDACDGVPFGFDVVRVAEVVPELTVAEVDALAHRAHFGQVDKLGVPYIEHVRTVAAGVAQFGNDLLMSGLLHDVIEDTDWTGERLVEAGVPGRVVAIVEAVTNVPGTSYQDKIRTIAHNREAALVKISDNAHNSHPVRLAALDEKTRSRLEKKYSDARKILWNAVDADEVRRILKIVNTDLLTEFHEFTRG